MATKTCKVCGESKELAQDTWVIKQGKPTGRICKTCANTASKLYKVANAAKITEARIKARSTAEGRARCSAAQAKYSAIPENRLRINAASRIRKATEEGRAKGNEYSLLWAKNNPAKVNAKNMRRHAAKLQRTPAWADLSKIQEFYEQAALLTKSTGISYEVDHIIPLRGKLVSGLHVHNNLQVITEAANCEKHNKFDLEEFNSKFVI